MALCRINFVLANHRVARKSSFTGSDFDHPYTCWRGERASKLRLPSSNQSPRGAPGFARRGTVHVMAASSIGVSGPCCFSGHVASGQPAGTFVKMGGVETYLAVPEGYEKGVRPRKAIIMLTDIFGVGLVNTLLLADQFAAQGSFLVAVPDLFGGSPVPASVMERMLGIMGLGEASPTTTVEWLQSRFRKTINIFTVVGNVLPFLLRHGGWKKKVPIAEAVYDDLKADYNIEHFGAIGYCYGGGFCLQWATLPDKLDAFVVAHTSVKVPQSLEKLQKPGLIIAADRDFSMTPKNREEIQEFIKTRLGDAEVEFTFYPGTYHGFASRGDETNPVISKAKEDAFQQSLAFFKKYVVG